MAFIFTARTGLNYRQYKKGTIAKKEFWRRFKLNSVTTLSSMAAGSGGAAAGFALGTVLMPGVGSILGAVMGGLAGGLAGEKLSSKAYKTIERKIQDNKNRKKITYCEMTELNSREAVTEEFQVDKERFEEALALLGVHNRNPTVNEI